jgi:hypothetical protein
MAHPDFVAGRLSTHFMDRLLVLDRAEAGARRRTVALIAAALDAYEQAGRRTPPPAPVGPNPWVQSGRPSARRAR